MILEKFKSYIESLPENASPVAEIRMSSAGDCQRRLDYEQQQGCKPLSAQHFLRMEMGNAIHDLVQELLKQAFGEDLYDVEREVSTLLPQSDFLLKGHPDGRFRSLKATLEIKTVSDATYTMIKNQGKPLDAHIDQGNLYAFTQGDAWVLVVYVNRDTGEWLEFMFETSSDLALRVALKFDAVIKNKAEGVMTKRPYHNMQESPCWFCPFKEDCYKDFTGEIARGSAAVFHYDTHPEVVKDVRDAIIHRRHRLLSTKLEDALKEKVGGFLHDKGISLANCEDELGLMSVFLKAGKNSNLLVEIKEKTK